MNALDFAQSHTNMSRLRNRHQSILEYMHRSGFEEAYEALKRDADMPEFSAGAAPQKVIGLLEKKWTGTVRLQKKVSCWSSVQAHACLSSPWTASEYSHSYSCVSADVFRLCSQVIAYEQQIANLEAELKAAPTGRRAASQADWLPSNDPSRILEGHRKQVIGVVFHPTFSVVATASEDCDVKVWDWQSGECEATLKGHTQSVKDVDFDPKGQYLGECRSYLCDTETRPHYVNPRQHHLLRIRRSSSGIRTTSGAARRR